MSTAKPSPINILGVRIDVMTMAAAAALILQQAATTKPPAVYVSKPYVEFLERAYRDSQVRDLLNHSWLNLPDSVSIQWAAAYLAGRPSWWRVMSLGAGIVFNRRTVEQIVPERFAGTVFTWKLLEAAAAAQAKVYLISSPATSTAEAAAAMIQQRLPAIRIAGTWPGEFDGLSGEALRRALSQRPVESNLVADLRTTQPDLILVGMGFPLQEELMAKLAPQLDHGVLVGEGGTFDYASFGGKLPKAPQWVQNIGLEWLWRLLRQPKRIRRQLAIPRFIWAVYRSSQAARKG